MEKQRPRQLPARLLLLRLQSCSLLHTLRHKGWALGRLLLAGQKRTGPPPGSRVLREGRLEQLFIPTSLKSPQPAKISTPFYLDYNEEILSAQLNSLPPTPLKAKPNASNSSLFSNFPDLDGQLDDLQQILKASHQISTIAPSSAQGCQGGQIQSFVKERTHRRKEQGRVGMLRTSINFFGRREGRGREERGWGSRGRFQSRF